MSLVATTRGQALELRSRIGFTRDEFARILPISNRKLATIEGGEEPSDAVRRMLTEIARVVASLTNVIQAEAIGPWLKTPNDALDGLKPLELIERGEIDRIWRMIYLLESGDPS